MVRLMTAVVGVSLIIVVFIIRIIVVGIIRIIRVVKNHPHHHDPRRIAL
jgi:hypothetical protein